MANSYYLISVDKLEQARVLAATEGPPNCLFQFCICPGAPKAIVQADWVDNEAIAVLGTYLGDLQPDGSAAQAVYEEMAKEEWRPNEK